MFSDSDEDERGSSRIIIPKARRAIHALPEMPVMTKRSINKTTQHSESEEDYDEVDNIKSVRPMSPKAANRRLNRSLSENFIESEKSDDTISEDVLSKSSPAEFFIHSYYRDENDQHSTSRVSNTSGSDVANNTLELYNQQLTNIEVQKSEKNCSNSKYIHHFIIVMIAISCCVYYYCDNNIAVKIYDKLNFYDDVKSLAQKYKIKQDSMLQLRTGIDTIYKKEDTGSFIFTFDGNVVNPVHFNDFMDNIASASSRYLRNNTKNVQHVVLDNNKIITFKSDVELIHEFREYVAKTGVLLVKNIERVPAKLAMAFHYYCDEYNPLIKKSAIFFTLDVTKCKRPPLRSLDHDYIERCLKDKWRDVDPERIGPLLTRVVTVIVDVTNI